MTSRFLLKTLPFLSVALLAACTTTTYEYVAPASDTGKLCVTQCAGVREMCRGNAMQRAHHEKASCERSAESNYRACIASATAGKTDPAKCQRRSCHASENTYLCDSDYRQCFANCGGRVIPHTTKH